VNNEEEAKTKKNVSMREMGRRLGVSAVTVSKALSGKPGVSDTVREQVENLAQELGYRYEMNSRTCKDVAILVPGHFFGHGNSFYASLCNKLVQQLSRRNGYGLLSILSEEEEAACRFPAIMLNNHISGLVVLGQVSGAYMHMLDEAKLSVPYVCMDFYDEHSGTDSVVSDGLYGSYRLTSHLIHRGHTRIGFYGSIRATSSIMDRYLGFYRAMLQHDLPIDPAWIVPDRDAHGEPCEYPLPDPLPTAFVCNCDQMAMLLRKRLEAMGLKVPDDVSLVGFDDYTYSASVSPFLTTFAVDQDSLARETARMITDKMNGVAESKGRVVTGGHLVYRRSVKQI